MKPLPLILMCCAVVWFYLQSQGGGLELPGMGASRGSSIPYRSAMPLSDYKSDSRGNY